MITAFFVEEKDWIGLLAKSNCFEILESDQNMRPLVLSHANDKMQISLQGMGEVELQIIPPCGFVLEGCTENENGTFTKALVLNGEFVLDISLKMA